MVSMAEEKKKASHKHYNSPAASHFLSSSVNIELIRQAARDLSFQKKIKNFLRMQSAEVQNDEFDDK